MKYIENLGYAKFQYGLFKNSETYKLFNYIK